LRIVFIGTSTFGIPVLRKLINLKENIVGVVTQPDRPCGRGKKIQPTPIKEIALKYAISVFQPEDINSQNSIKEIKKFDPELIILIAYGQILKGQVLDIPSRGCLNVHPSLLPKYKGSAPIQWAIIRGEQETGISFLFMNEKIDSGDIVLQKKVKIIPGENFQQLSQRLADESAEILPELLDNIKNGNIKKIAQPKGNYFYARKICKTDCKIDWLCSGADIINLIKGIAYLPCAFAVIKNKRIKITEAELIPKEETEEKKQIAVPGEIVSVSKKGLQVMTGDNSSVLIKRLIIPGRKEMDVAQFINGYQIEAGNKFE